MKIVYRTHRPTPWTACSIRKTTRAQHGYAAMRDFYLGIRAGSPPADAHTAHVRRRLGRAAAAPCKVCIMQHLTANAQNVNVSCGVGGIKRSEIGAFIRLLMFYDRQRVNCLILRTTVSLRQLSRRLHLSLKGRFSNGPRAFSASSRFRRLTSFALKAAETLAPRCKSSAR
jgi:hypothetical protein